MSYFKQSEILERDHWNQKLINKLLGEADIVEKQNGRVRKKFFDKVRVNEAEQSAYFLKVTREAKAIETQRKTQDQGLCDSLDTALRLDLSIVKIEKQETFEQTFVDLQKQFLLINNMLSINNTFHLPRPYNIFCSVRDQNICNLIAEKIPEYAYRAGQTFALIGLQMENRSIPDLTKYLEKGQ